MSARLKTNWQTLPAGPKSIIRQTNKKRGERWKRREKKTVWGVGQMPGKLQRLPARFPLLHTLSRKRLGRSRIGSDSNTANAIQILNWFWQLSALSEKRTRHLVLFFKVKNICWEQPIDWWWELLITPWPSQRLWLMPGWQCQDRAIERQQTRIINNNNNNNNIQPFRPSAISKPTNRVWAI